jgi:hypothetical protein
MTDHDPFTPLDDQEGRLASSDDPHRQDATGDDEIIMPVPEYAEPLRQALKRDWGRKPSDVWWYWDANGDKSFAVVRFDDAGGKTYRPFCWVRSATGEGWKAQSVPAPRPLFNLNKLAARPDAPVLVVEGEKCARDGEKVFPGYVVVTSPGGANAAAKADWDLKNREVLVWPDADEAGRKYANDVARILHNLGVSKLRVVDASALASRAPDGTTREPPLGWDVANAIEEDWEPEALRKAAEEAAKPWADPAGTNGTNGKGSYGENSSSPEVNAWEYPDLSYLGSGRSVPPQFPLEVLGEFWGSWCSKHAMARNAPVDYVAGTLLSVAGALIGNKRWPYANGEWGEPPILWIGLVGAPGSGKSPAQDPVVDLVRQLEGGVRDEMAEEIKSYRENLVVARAAHEKWERDVKHALGNDEDPPEKPTAAIEPKEPVVPRLIISDTTPEKVGPLLQKHPAGLLLHRDELAGWIGSFNRYSGGGENGERQLWTEAYGGRPYNIDRVKLSEPIFIPHLTVGVLGSIQPDKLPVMTGGADDGFASRFLWIWPDPVEGFTLNQGPIDSAKQIDALRHLFRLELPAQGQGGGDPGRIELSDEAAHHFENFVRDVRERAVRGVGLFAGALSKAAGYVLRVAMVFEFLDWVEDRTSPEPKMVCSESMLKATKLVGEYFLPMAQRVFNEAAISLEEQRAMTLIRWLRDHDTRKFNARETRRTIGGILRESTHMNAACKTLERAGLIRPAFSRAGESKGQRRKDYEVNPVVFAGQP